MNRNLKAFSLVELSIVILVVAILVSGVMQGLSLVRKFNIKTAQSLTDSSPVAGIKNLVLWLETSKEESVTFNDDGNVISWNDINPQSLEKHNATPSTASFTYYKEKGVNGLPSMFFNGVNAGFNVSNVPLYQSDNTIFIAEKHYGSKIGGCFICSGSNYSFIYIWEFGTQAVRHNNATFATKYYINPRLPTKDTVYIHSLVEDIDDSFNYNMQYNKISYSNSAAISGLFTGNPNLNITIGYGSWNGIDNVDIAEIIIYNRALKEEERQAVMSYLKQKYGVIS